MGNRYVWALTLIVVAVMALHLKTRPANATLVIYPAEAETVIHSDAILSQAAAAVLTDEFASAPYFAAFAVDEDGRFGWATRRHNAEDAQAAALARCNRGGSGCVIFAERLPLAYDPDRAGVTVSQTSTEDGLIDTLPSEGRVIVALGRDGAWSVQRLQDGILLPGFFTKHRCDAIQRESPQPIYLPALGCALYRGQVEVVKDNRPRQMPRPSAPGTVSGGLARG